MACRLAGDVQVRKEGWGLLFYLQSRHRVFLVRSGDWLYPRHFDGTWTWDGIADDIVKRTGTPPEMVARSLPGLARRMMGNRIVVDELR